MSRMVSVDADERADILRRLRALETVTNLFAASVTAGRVRIGGTATLLVDSSGGIIIHGLLDGDGTFTWSGTMTNTGPVNLDGDTTITGDTTVQGPFHVDGATDINGDTTVTGPFHVNGATDINGTLAVKGATTLSNSLNVAAGGGITIDSTNALQLSPGGNHAVQWALGAYLASNDGGVGMGASGHNAAIQAAADGTAALFYPNGQIAVWTSAVNGLSFYSPDGTKVMRLTNTGLVGP